MADHSSRNTPCDTPKPLWEEFLNDNPRKLDELFDHFDPSARVAQRLVQEQFDQPYNSRTPLLRKYASAAPPTLREQVRMKR